MKKILIYPLLIFMALAFCACDNNEDSQSSNNFGTVNADGFDFGGSYWLFESIYDYYSVFIFEQGLVTELYVDAEDFEADVYIDDKGYIHGISRDMCSTETVEWRIVDTKRFIYAYVSVNYVVVDNDTVEIDGADFIGTMYRTKGFAE